MIVSLGEALIDVIHSSSPGNPVNRIGGSPFNVAIAMSRLGIESGFICPLSTDHFGDKLAEALRINDVRQCVEERVKAPTARAEVFTDSTGHPTYRFYRDETADRALDERPPVLALPPTVKAIHFGSLVLAQSNDWLAWKAAIIAARDRGAFIAFDPNIRLPLIDDMEQYRERLHEAISLSDLVKASDEDLLLLYPNHKPEVTIQEWCRPHRMVVLTEGSKGAQLWTISGRQTVYRPEPIPSIVDTVGAGDTFQAALLAWLSHENAFHDDLTTHQSHTLLGFAHRAAALNCTKHGCDPPVLSAVLQSTGGQ
jgi:fructokinase